MNKEYLNNIPYLFSLLICVIASIYLINSDISPLSSLILIVFLLSFIFLLIRILISKRKNILNIFLIITFSVFVLETGLRYGTKKYFTYFELLQGRYQSYYDIYVSPQLSYSPNDTLTFESKGEYKYTFTTNSLGFCDKEWNKEKKSNEYRVLGMGDSFTLGMGAPMDSSWIKSFERNFKLSDREISTMNSGVTGSDINIEFYKLKNILIDFQPDLVILGINVSDVVDIYLRGGSIQSNEPTFEPRKSPLGKMENLYKVSFLYRAYVHTILDKNFLFLNPDEAITEETLVVAGMISKIEEFRNFCNENRIDFYFFTHPHGFEIIEGKYMNSPFKKVAQALPEIGNDFMNNFIQLGINKTNKKEYFYPIDRHFTSKGYSFLGKLVADKVQNNLNL